MIVRIESVKTVARWCVVTMLVLLAIDALLAGYDPGAYVAALLLIGWLAARASE